MTPEQNRQEPTSPAVLTRRNFLKIALTATEAFLLAACAPKALKPTPTETKPGQGTPLAPPPTNAITETINFNEYREKKIVPMDYLPLTPELTQVFKNGLGNLNPELVLISGAVEAIDKDGGRLRFKYAFVAGTINHDGINYPFSDATKIVVLVDDKDQPVRVLPALQGIIEPDMVLVNSSFNFDDSQGKAVQTPDNTQQYIAQIFVDKSTGNINLFDPKKAFDAQGNPLPRVSYIQVDGKYYTLTTPAAGGLLAPVVPTDLANQKLAEWQSRYYEIQVNQDNQLIVAANLNPDEISFAGHLSAVNNRGEKETLNPIIIFKNKFTPIEGMDKWQIPTIAILNINTTPSSHNIKEISDVAFHVEGQTPIITELNAAVSTDQKTIYFRNGGETLFALDIASGQMSATIKDASELRYIPISSDNFGPLKPTEIPEPIGPTPILVEDYAGLGPAEIVEVARSDANVTDQTRTEWDAKLKSGDTSFFKPIYTLNSSWVNLRFVQELYLENLMLTNYTIRQVTITSGVNSGKKIYIADTQALFIKDNQVHELDLTMDSFVADLGKNVFITPETFADHYRVGSTVRLRLDYLENSVGFNHNTLNTYVRNGDGKIEEQDALIIAYAGFGKLPISKNDITSRLDQPIASFSDEEITVSNITSH